MKPAAIWTDARIQLLITLHRKGWSSTRIAAELGGVSRNAVIGKLYRMGKLVGEHQVGSPEHQSIAAKRNRPKSIPARKGGAKRITKPVAPVQRPLRIVEKKPRRKLSVMDLEPHHCRYPIGDVGHPDFTFCGEAKEVESYCAHHAALVFNPQSDRKRFHNWMIIRGRAA